MVKGSDREKSLAVDHPTLKGDLAFLSGKISQKYEIGVGIRD